MDSEHKMDIEREVLKGGHLSDELLLLLLKLSVDNINSCPFSYRLTKRLIVLTVQGVRRLRTRSKIDENVSIPILCQQVWHTLCSVELTEEEAEHAVSETDRMVLVYNTATKPARHTFYEDCYRPLADNCSNSEAFQAAMEPVYRALERDWVQAKVNPWAHLRFSKDLSALEIPRSKCDGCGKSVRVMCPWCVRTPFPSLLPSVALNLRVIALLHPAEPRQGSSIVQAAVLCPEVELLEQCPPLDPSSSVLLYPSPEAKWLDETPLQHVKTVVLIESPWRFSAEVARGLSHIPHVKIRHQAATHWRFQPLGKEFLCTVEALYYFLRCRDHQNPNSAENSPISESKAMDTVTTKVGCIDDLLFLYAHQHSNILAQQMEGTERPLKSWQPRAHRVAPSG